MALHKEEERLCRELGNKAWLQASLGNQANILYSRGDLDGALALYKEQERLCRELGDPQGLPISLANQANLLKGIPDRRDEAHQLADEASLAGLAEELRTQLAVLTAEWEELMGQLESS